MDDLRIGAACRALRRRRGWRQIDLASRSACHQTTISRIERGQLATLSMATLRAVFTALEARFQGDLRWRGAEVDRILDAEHAAIVEAVAGRFAASGWVVEPEVSFSEFGERGSIDLLASFEAASVVAVVEVKSAIGDVQATLRAHDAKARVARRLAANRLGWTPRAVVRVLAVPDDRTVRRVVAQHGRTFQAVYPAATIEVRRWLAEPAAARSGIWFLTRKYGRHASPGRRSSARLDPPRSRTRSSRPAVQPPQIGPDR